MVLQGTRTHLSGRCFTVLYSSTKRDLSCCSNILEAMRFVYLCSYVARMVHFALIRQVDLFIALRFASFPGVIFTHFDIQHLHSRPLGHAMPEGSIHVSHHFFISDIILHVPYQARSTCSVNISASKKGRQPAQQRTAAQSGPRDYLVK